MRYFLKLEDAKKIILDEITLLDDNLIIKKINNKGEIILEPILSTEGYDKTQVDEFAKYCSSNNSELLVEIYEYEFYSRKLPKDNIRTYQIQNNGTYIDLKNFNKEISLIEPGALLHTDLKKFNPKELKLVEAIPDINDNNTLYLNQNPNQRKIKPNKNISEMRTLLNNESLGADLYLYTENKEALDEARTWITKLNNLGNNKYTIKKKNYFLIKPLLNDEIISLSNENLELYNNLILNSVDVSKQRVNNHLVLNKVSSNDFDHYLLVHRENIESLLKNGTNNIPFEDIIEVITQENDQFIKTNLQDALDIPKTYINNKVTDYESKDAYKMDIFYEQDPVLPLLKILKKGTPVEMEIVDQTEEGYPVWKESIKIVQNEHNIQFAERLNNKNHKYLIKISGMPNEEEVLNLLEDSGTLIELVKYNDNNNNKFNYYIEKPYDKTQTIKNVK